MSKVTKTLKNNGYKITPQRLAVYNVLKNTKKHPCADSIYNSLQPLFPSMSLATVYKSLEVFKNLGLIQEINLGEGSFRYDANTRLHPHVICLKCGRVDDIENFDCLELESVELETAYKIIGHQLYFYGYCPQCID